MNDSPNLLPNLGSKLAIATLLAAMTLPAAAQDKVLARASSESAKTQPQVAAPAPAPAKIIATTQAVPAPAKKPAVATTAPKPAPKAAARKPAPKRLPTYGNPAEGDDPSRDDPQVRAAAIDALGNLIGSVVVVEPDTGRVLTVVNQKLAFSDGYQPCSAFKPAVALAALGEGIIENDKNKLELGKKWYLDLHKALALSNNLYFEMLGRSLGIAKLEQYARKFGFGEPAGLNIETEPQGGFPDKAPPVRAGGVGRVASFGQGIAMTMLQLASFTSAIANGGTLYYLQYPAPEELAYFEPKVKRELGIESSIEVVRSGMEEAVLTGTARRAKQPDVHILGKTGTCSQATARLGWFAGYNKEPGGVAIVVLLRTGVKLGGGPRASQVAGAVFRKLGDQNFYARDAYRFPSQALPASIQLPAFP